MSLALGLTLVVASAPLKVAVPGFTIAGIDPSLGDAFVAHFVSLLERDPSIALTTQADIAQVLGLERQKQLLGCSENQASCLAELAGALGADAILTGSIARVGTGYLATLRLLKARDAQQLFTATERLDSEDALQDWLELQAPRVSRQLRTAFGVETLSVGGTSRAIRFVPGIGGAALAVAGTVMFGLSRRNADLLQRGATEPGTFTQVSEIQSTAANGKALESAGVALLITGAAAIVASALWVALAPSSPVQAALVPTGGGAATVVEGRF